MKRSELKRSEPMKPKRRSTGPDRLVVETVWERDQGRCGWCSEEITGERGTHWSVHHRRPRRAGGDPREDTNSPANLVILHGTGSIGCHGKIESERSQAYADGFLLRYNDVPSQVAIEHAVHGRVFLSDDGWYSVERPPLEVA